jgi:hypothetical protein
MMQPQNSLNRRRRAPGLLLVALAAVLAGGLSACRMAGDPLTPALEDGASKTPIIPVLPGEPFVQPYSQEALSTLWSGSSHQNWDVISGFVDPVEGGRIQGRPASWPDEEQYTFGIIVPPGALRGGDVVQISILVPQQAAKAGEIAPVVHFEPDGIVFNKPVTVQVCHPYWMEPADEYARFCLVQAGTVEDPYYYVTDYAKALPPDPENAPRTISYSVTHFSRWGTQNGSGGLEGLLGPNEQREYFSDYRETRR